MAVDVMAVYRLDKFLSLNGFGSRSEVRKLLRRGQVTKNGVTQDNPETKIDSDRDVVAVNGSAISFAQTVYYLLNKPAGVITATEDKRHKTVMDLLPDKRTDLFPVGRLDIDTEGLLLITNDGITGHRLLSPKRHVDKTYYVETDLPIPKDAADRFTAGLNLGDFISMPAKFVQKGEKSGCLTICEGKFHQVKRMFEAIGVEVVYLKRLSMGPLTLGNLCVGESRPLTKEEIQAILQI